ncbi:CATRA system-associated protein [Lentzea sp. BCCO 10_0061]|uniref:CATRA system-associated protein n=1 Tax=Lentzea sokolovensis TaxID=3095429 RepID=A0ABU4UPZ9_9PSEU|nr:CATRA system-associated protein [Lentzea sp. BCCO 10_0061]MDX8141565.1 CATRA system-associated protein [Lentzea sp. BCCO 10_0061]
MTPQEADIEDNSRLTALAVLREVPEWYLPAHRWELVAQVLDRVAIAHDIGDAAALFRAAAELDAISPVLVKRIGEEPVGPPPPPTRDRLNLLIHTLEDDDDTEPAEAEE